MLTKNTLTDDHIKDVGQVLKTSLLPTLTGFNDVSSESISMNLEVFSFEFKKEPSLFDNGFSDSIVDSFLEDGFPLAIYLFDLLFAEPKRCQHALLFLNELFSLGFFFLLPEQNQLDIYVEAVAFARLISLVIVFPFNFFGALLDVSSHLLCNIIEFFLRDTISHNSRTNLGNFSREAASKTYKVCLIDFGKRYLFFSFVGSKVAE